MEGVQKRKKPQFLRTEWNKKPRLRTSKNTKWRRARGRHSKIRQKMKGNTKAPNIGYGMPNEIKGLVKGMKPVLVHNLNDLDKVSKGEIVVVSGSMGGRKKVALAEKALKMNLTFENFNPQKILDSAKSSKKPEVKAEKEKPKKEEQKK